MKEPSKEKSLRLKKNLPSLIAVMPDLLQTIPDRQSTTVNRLQTNAVS